MNNYMEDINLVMDLIQQAKGVDGPKGGFVTDSLDAAENHLGEVVKTIQSLTDELNRIKK